MSKRKKKNKRGINPKPFLAPPKKRISLKSYDPGSTAGLTKAAALRILEANARRIAQLQDVLFADGTRSLLVIFQGMDAAGKDSTIKRVMDHINPMGIQVHSFKAPSAEDLAHDYLWRCVKGLPERGKIGVHNRSYYEETIVVRVHPEILKGQRLPDDLKDAEIWTRRFREMVNFERYLTDNGTAVLKFFLNVSKKRQAKRFQERIDTPDKRWKFSIDDIAKRAMWDEYMKAYEKTISATSTNFAPWYVVPSDNKWFTAALISTIIVSALESMKLKYPTLSVGIDKRLGDFAKHLKKK